MITERIYYYIKLETLSPLSIGNGSDELTDHDLIRDSQNNIFIPATSLAGVIVHSLSELEQNIILPDVEEVASDGKKLIAKAQCPLFISDATITSNYHTSIRDGVALDEDKVSKKGAKFDIEIVEKGAQLDFRMELTIRENDDSQEMQKIVQKIINNINNGTILVGMKAKRGFGKLKIVEAYQKHFSKSDLTALLNFDKYNCNNYEKMAISKVNNENYDVIDVKLKQKGGISIKAYSAKAGEVDFEHVKANGVPVIPGTSWNGLLKRQINYYHKLLGAKSSKMIDEWFGYVQDKKAKASSVIIEESIISEGKEMTIVRNTIDRFSGGNKNRALFNERSHFNGKTNLVIKVPKTITINNKLVTNDYILGLIALAIKDIENGLIALGGQTSIGRGIFEVLDVTINDEKSDLDKLIQNISLKDIEEEDYD